MPFDANLVLVDGSADWTYDNLVSSDYGTPTSTTRNNGGFAVIDLGEVNIGSDPNGIAVVVVLPAANADDDALTLVVQESSVANFASDVHNLVQVDKAAANIGVILGSECPTTIIKRFIAEKRYLRVDASCVAGDDFGKVQVLLSPYPYKKL